MVRWRSLLVACGVISLSACHRGAKIPIKSDQALFLSESRVLLIDRRYQLAAPGGSAIEPLLVAYDLNQDREVWRTFVSDANVDLSPSRKFASVLAFTTKRSVHLGVVDLSTGQYRRLDIWPPDPRDFVRHPEATSISDDGALFASVLDDRLRIWDTATTKLLYENEFEADGPRVVEFLAASHDLTVELSVPPAYDEGPPTLAILTRRTDGWQVAQRLEDIRGYNWTSRGLMYGSARGVAVYDRGELRSLMTAQADSTAFSSDGRYVAYRTPGNSLNVYDLNARRVVLVARWLKPPRFHRNYVTIMANGLLWRGDLADGTSKVLRDFGPRSETVKIPFFGGTTTNTRYDYVLSDEGTRLYYKEPNSDARMYDVERF